MQDFAAASLSLSNKWQRASNPIQLELRALNERRLRAVWINSIF
jgi:hypothetical protein